MILSSTSPYGLLKEFYVASGRTPFFAVVPIISDGDCTAVLISSKLLIQWLRMNTCYLLYDVKMFKIAQKKITLILR